MNLHIDTRSVIPAIIIVASIGSLSYITIATLNYSQYWTGLSEISTNLSTLSVGTDPGSSTTSLLLKILVGNPSGYSGFNLNTVQATVWFFNSTNPSNSNDTVFALIGLSGVLGGHRPLNPHSTIESDISINLTQAQSSDFAAFSQAHSGRITAAVIIQVQIDTFLDRVAGKYIFQPPLFNFPLG